MSLNGRLYPVWGFYSSTTGSAMASFTNWHKKWTQRFPWSASKIECTVVVHFYTVNGENTNIASYINIVYLLDDTTQILSQHPSPAPLENRRSCSSFYWHSEMMVAWVTCTLVRHDGCTAECHSEIVEDRQPSLGRCTQWIVDEDEVRDVGTKKQDSSCGCPSTSYNSTVTLWRELKSHAA